MQNFQHSTQLTVKQIIEMQQILANLNLDLELLELQVCLTVFDEFGSSHSDSGF